MKKNLKYIPLLTVLLLTQLTVTGCVKDMMLGPRPNVRLDYCKTYNVVPTLHCKDEQGVFTHCTPEQELNVDKNNAVHMENCK